MAEQLPTLSGDGSSENQAAATACKLLREARDIIDAKNLAPELAARIDHVMCDLESLYPTPAN
jgi:hypothetical protein